VSETITSAIDFLNKIKVEKMVSIKFKKQDGTVRLMHCTLDFSKIPREKHPKGVDLAKILKLINDKHILRVYDLEKQDWRSVPFDRVDYLVTPSNKKSYIIKLK
jgi:Holliday junction resolvase